VEEDEGGNEAGDVPAHTSPSFPTQFRHVTRVLACHTPIPDLVTREIDVRCRVLADGSSLKAFPPLILRHSLSRAASKMKSSLKKPRNPPQTPVTALDPDPQRSEKIVRFNGADNAKTIHSVDELDRTFSDVAHTLPSA
jgi:hypothetical protein